MADELTRVIVTLERMEGTITKEMAEIKKDLASIDTGFSEHLRASDQFEIRLGNVETTVTEHKEMLMGRGRLISRVEKIEEKMDTFNKVLWEIARPMLGLLGVMLLTGLGIFGVLFYGLSVLIQNIP